MRIIPFVCGGPDSDIQNCQALGGEVHYAVREPLLELQESAKKAGFGLKVASAHRGFERQLVIWNAKALGHRPVLDQQGCPIDLDTLTDSKKMFAILRWSALPGTSRHHWGTDFDVFDDAHVGTDYKLKLVPEEYLNGGPFYRFSQWLDKTMLSNKSCGFFRPYAIDRGGVAPELWHISHRPTAIAFERRLSLELVAELIESVDIELKETVLDHINEIFSRFVQLNNSQ